MRVIGNRWGRQGFGRLRVVSFLDLHDEWKPVGIHFWNGECRWNGLCVLVQRTRLVRSPGVAIEMMVELVSLSEILARGG
jgi:hypothetical protein